MFTRNQDTEEGLTIKGGNITSVVSCGTLQDTEKKPITCFCGDGVALVAGLIAFLTGSGQMPVVRNVKTCKIYFADILDAYTGDENITLKQFSAKYGISVLVPHNYDPDLPIIEAIFPFKI